jgi:uncharacterized membrane protein YhaH (DUF805 family)
MVRIPSFKGRTGPGSYLIAVLALLALQYLAVVLVFRASHQTLVADSTFWILPMRRLALLPYLPAWCAALAFAFSLALTWALAMLSFRRARWSGRGYVLAAFAIVPAVQIVAIALLAVLPRLGEQADTDVEYGIDVAHVLQGVLAGVGIIVAAVLVSAIGFGAYGWGLFVMTPFMVGITTAYLANRRRLMTASRTVVVVLAAAALGTVALVMFALEGIVCIVLAAPLGAVVAMIGALIGRSIARRRHSRDQPLMSIALLPALFALEAAMPPAVPIATDESIDIPAPPQVVWDVLTSNAPIAEDPGIVGVAGLAYPIRGRLMSTGVGALRLGDFSTGTARERVTEWVPGRKFAFVVLRQPPAMEEMSPYRRVHAPHLNGYFNTGETRFALTPLPNGSTRLTLRAESILRIDPVLYWEPIARLAVHLNAMRVLHDIEVKAEAASASSRGGESLRRN